MRLSTLFLACACAAPVVMNAAPAARPEATTPLPVGASAPAVMVRSAEGEAVDLGAAVRGQPTILIFYRGGWCPYCNMHLAQLQEIEESLLEMGFQILAVSPDRPESLQASVDKNQLGYRLLSDRGMIASEAYGVAFRLSDEILAKYNKWGFDLAEVPGEPDARWLPIPAVFVIGTDGIVRFVHTNPDYKQRISSEELLAAAAAAQE